jgi:hypothetical protein
LLWSPAALAGPFDGTWEVDHDASISMFDPQAHPWMTALFERFQSPPPPVTVSIDTSEETMSMSIVLENKAIERTVLLDDKVRAREGAMGWMFDERHRRTKDGSLVADVRTPLHEVRLTLQETDDPDTIEMSIEVKGHARRGLRVLRRE